MGTSFALWWSFRAQAKKSIAHLSFFQVKHRNRLARKMRPLSFIFLLLTSMLRLTAQDHMTEATGKVVDLSGHAKGGQAPYEKAANAINDELTARYHSATAPAGLADEFNELGALSGFGCQMAIRETFVKPGIMAEDKAFVVVRTKDGGKYFFGDFLNIPLLAVGQVSVWSLVAGAAQKSGAKDLPNIQEIAAYNARTLGTKDFGVPRIPEPYRARQLPIEILRKDWPAMQKLVNDYQVDPKFLGWTFALATQYLILKNKDTFDPKMAALIVMEAALPMSKIDPATIGVDSN